MPGSETPRMSWGARLEHQAVVVKTLYLNDCQVKLVTFCNEVEAGLPPEETFAICTPVHSLGIKAGYERYSGGVLIIPGIGVFVRRINFELDATKCAILDTEFLRGHDGFRQCEDAKQLGHLEIVDVTVAIGVHLQDGDFVIPEHHADELVNSPNLDDGLIEFLSLRFDDAQRKHGRILSTHSWGLAAPPSVAS